MNASFIRGPNLSFEAARRVPATRADLALRGKRPARTNGVDAGGPGEEGSTSKLEICQRGPSEQVWPRLRAVCQWALDSPRPRSRAARDSRGSPLRWGSRAGGGIR